MAPLTLTKKTRNILIGLLALIVCAGAGFYWYQKANTVTYLTVPVKRGAITQEVSASGNVAAPATIELQFQNLGKVRYIRVAVGDTVSAGQVIAQQDTSILNAQLQQARAAYDAVVASGNTTSLPLVTTDARQTYASAYSTLDAVLHNDIDTFFGEPTPFGPLLLIDSHIKAPTTFSRQRAALGYDMNDWRDRLKSASATEPSALLEQASGMAQKVSDFITELAFIANQPDSQATTVQLTALTAARTAVNALAAGITAAQASFRSGSVGATASVSASIRQAAASIGIIQAQIAQGTLVSPIAGTVTEVNANVGETVLPSTVVVSILPHRKLQVDVNISEDNVANVKIGDSVRISLDAFPGVAWKGKIGKIDPAQTVIGGAVYYHATVELVETDPRIKSGMTANVLVQTGSATSTFIIPASALQVSGTSTTVRIEEGGKAVSRSVVTGLKSQDGMVEIKSGVSEGEAIIMGEK